jgi:hypothetical protein
LARSSSMTLPFISEAYFSTKSSSYLSREATPQRS